MPVQKDTSTTWPHAQDVAVALGSARGAGDQWYASCPAHDDRTASLSIKTAEDGRLLINCHAGCERQSVIDALKSRGLWHGSPQAPRSDDSAKPQRKTKVHSMPPPKRQIVATYDYCDENGVLLYQKIRYEPKGFSQRIPDGQGWSYKLGNVRRVLYRLPEIIAHPERAVFIVEGEKDADALTAAGRIATCNDSGAGKWNPDFSKILSPRTCIVVADNDAAGRDHARLVAESLRNAGCKTYIVTFTDLPEHGDISDWLATHPVQQLIAACTTCMRTAATVLIDGLRVALFSESAATPDPAPQSDPEPVPESIIEPITGEKPARYTEDAIADEFMATRLTDLRYCHDWGKWLLWNGKIWQLDKTAEINHRVRHYCRDLAAQVMADPGLQPKTRAALQSKLGSLALQRNIEAMARTDQAIAVRNTDLDNDPLLIGTPAGAWSLLEGRLLPHSRDRLITKSMRFPIADKPSAVWCKFVEWITCGDQELAKFLQRMAGYCLTGDISEHALFFLYGPGGNGKSVFLNMLAYVFGDYATSANMETFMHTQGDRHTTELARLQGARLVTALESDADRAWAEGKIKALTGGDRITARYMRQDNFEFDPQFKLVLVGNHMPRIVHVDAAMRRRLHMIPFMAKVDAEHVDPGLPAKLREHGGGILRWCVEGCMAWREQGLSPPAAVAKATDTYFTEEDIVFAFIRAKLTPSPGNVLPVKGVYDAYASFTREAGEKSITAKEFNRALARHDILVTSDQRGWSSIIGYSMEIDYSDVEGWKSYIE